MCKDLDECIKDILILIGIPVNVVGFKYITTATKMAIENPNLLSSITRTLYPSIASAYLTTANSVERAIRHALTIASNKDKLILLNGIFEMKIYQKHERPCNSEFIALLSEKIPALHKQFNSQYSSLNSNLA